MEIYQIMIDLQLGTGLEISKSSFVKETDETTFEQDVLTASMKLPVIVAFWGMQNPVCQQINSTLEKQVSTTNGKISLVKINIDNNAALAQAMQLETVPTIYVFFQGKPIDGFTGSKTEEEIAAFVDKINKLYGKGNEVSDSSAMSADEIKKIMTEADDFFQKEDYDEAMSNYNIVLEANNKNMDSLGGIGWCLLAHGDTESVREMLANLNAAQLKNSRLKGLKFVLSMEDKAKELAGMKELESKEDLQSLFDLSIHYLATGKFEKSTETLISILRKDRNWEDKKAHNFLLEIFEAFGEIHPLTSSGRRKLSSILFS